MSWQGVLSPLKVALLDKVLRCLWEKLPVPVPSVPKENNLVLQKIPDVCLSLRHTRIMDEIGSSNRKAAGCSFLVSETGRVARENVIFLQELLPSSIYIL